MKQSFDFVKKDLKKLQERYGKKLQEYTDRYRDPNYVTTSAVWTRIDKQHEIYKDAYRIISNLLEDAEKGVLRL